MSQSKKRHPFHLVDPSPWPLLASFSALTLSFGAGLYFHGYNDGAQVLISGFLTLVIIAVLWWRDVVRESTFLGNHTIKVQYGLRFGMLLFIVSEIMFFVSFFWAFFHSSISPSVEIGGVCLHMVL
jgi:cytochrome c oxidase subunit 3